MTTTGQKLKNSKGWTQSGRLTYENTEQYIEVNGIKIHYHEAGTEHEHTVVFLHGGGLGTSGWFNFYLNIEPFSVRFRTILIDMPNFGRSDSIVLNDCDAQKFDADILSEFLRLKGIDRASLVGNSKGGGDAIAFSVHHADQLHLNVLMGAATGPSLFDVMPPQGTALLIDIYKEPTREKVDKLLHLFVYDDSFVDDDWVDLRWNGILDAERRGFRQAFLDSTSTYVNYTGQLSGVATPTLIVLGAYDRFAALDSSISLMRHYQDSELHVFRNCGHWVQFEMHEEFNSLLIRWMESKLES
jgi:pimeloyl-ACP methyl ester carboxylesterase